VEELKAKILPATPTAFKKPSPLEASPVKEEQKEGRTADTTSKQQAKTAKPSESSSNPVSGGHVTSATGLIFVNLATD